MTLGSFLTKHAVKLTIKAGPKFVSGRGTDYLNSCD